MEINLKLTISFLLPAAVMLLMAACGGESQTADTETPEAKVVAKVEVGPSPTKEPSKSESARPPTPKPGPTEARRTALAKTAEVAMFSSQFPIRP